MHLNKIAVGYEEIEAALLGLVATGKNVLLIGKHGNAKTTVGKALTGGFGKDADFQYVDCSTADLLSVAGIPNPRALAEGRFEIATHKRSVMRKGLKLVLLDEITRAPKETQNMLLEMLAEGTMYAEPLDVEAFIATANPSSYASANKMDQALLDRFHAVLPINDFQDAEREHIREMINLNLGNKRTSEDLKELFDKIRKNYEWLSKQEKLVEMVGDFTAKIMRIALVKKGKDGDKKSRDEVYISPRTMAKTFVETLVACASYYKAIGEAEFLQEGARQAIRYGLAQKIDGIQLSVLETEFRELKVILKSDVLTPAGQLRVEWVQLDKFDEKLKFLDEHREEIADLDNGLPQDEVVKMIGDTFIEHQSDHGKLLRLYNVAKEYPEEYQEARWQIASTLVQMANASLGSVIRDDADLFVTDRETFEKFSADNPVEYLEKVKELPETEKEELPF